MTQKQIAVYFIFTAGTKSYFRDRDQDVKLDVISKKLITIYDVELGNTIVLWVSA